jgi:hypothetical protein
MDISTSGENASELVLEIASIYEFLWIVDISIIIVLSINEQGISFLFICIFFKFFSQWFVVFIIQVFHLLE